jgi:hypothetical protein
MKRKDFPMSRNVWSRIAAAAAVGVTLSTLGVSTAHQVDPSSRVTGVSDEFTSGADEVIAVAHTDYIYTQKYLGPRPLSQS